MGIFGGWIPGQNGPKQPGVPDSPESLDDIPTIGQYLEPAAVARVLAVVDEYLATVPRRSLFDAIEVLNMLLDIRVAVVAGLHSTSMKTVVPRPAGS